MKRNTLGLIALFLIAIGVIATWLGPAGGSALGFAGPCVKAGLVLGALWLALPQIMSFFARAPKWLLAASAIGIVICIVNPWLILLAIPALGALWYFGPRLGTKADKPIVETKRPRRRSNS
jgi:hypothetical protein